MSRRILLKFRAERAEQLRQAMPSASMYVSPYSVQDAELQQFMTRYSAHTISPLYPELVRAATQRQVSGQQLAAEVYQRFTTRSRRLQTAFAPPDISRTYVMELQNVSAEEVARVLALLRSDVTVEFAEEDKLASICIPPDDPFFSSTGSWGQAYDDLWGIKKIGAPAAWSTNAGDGILVAVVDTGVDRGHPDITANLWSNTREISGNGLDDDGNGYVDDVVGWNFVSRTNDPADDHGHGSHVSGTIAATGNNGAGVIGVAWRAKVMPLKALDKDGNGWDSDLAQAIIYAANNGADVISNSWRQFGDSQTIAEAVSYAYNMGVVLIAAAGNDYSDVNLVTPAKLKQVVTVAASMPDDSLAAFSNRGDKIDIAAPGYDILSLRASGTSMGTAVNAEYTRASGTSMAAPHVSGVAALILAQHPLYSNEQVRQVLRSSATDTGAAGFDLQFGYGRLNADFALLAATPLEARISSPSSGLQVNAPVSIQGVAQGLGFSYYTLEYGAGASPTSWTLFKTNSSPVSGELGTFDPTTVPHGTYTIRLTAWNSTGQAYADQVQVVANHITLPSRETIKLGAPLTLTGTVVAAGLQNYTIDWARGASATTGWQSTGITLANDGTANVRNGVLATWNTSVLGAVAADYYTLRLTVTAASYSDEIRTVVYVEPDLLSANWPRWLQGMYVQEAGVFPVIDVGGNTQLAAITQHATPHKLQLYSWDGTNQKTVSLSDAGGWLRLFQPAAGKIAGSTDSIAVGGLAGMDIIRPDLSAYRLPAGATISFLSSHVLLDDVDGDSQPEVVAIGNDGAWSGTSGYLYAWRQDGRQVGEKFPIPISNQNTSLGWGTPRVSTGDIDGDGSKEFVVLEGTSATTFAPLLFAADGTQRTWAAPTLNGSARQLVLADLDHNGKLETLILTQDGYLHVLRPDGTERPGWPQRQCYPSGYGTLAVGDLNRDGRDEIVASDWGLDVFNADGSRFSSAWPLDPDHSNPMSLYGPAVLADVNGDGLPEIILCLIEAHTAFPSTDPRYITYEVAVFDQNAAKIKSWNLFGTQGHTPDSTVNYMMVGDFDKDGMAEIAASLKTNKMTAPSDGILYVFKTNARFDAAANDWPMLFRNPQNSPVLLHTAGTAATVSSSANPSVVGQALDFEITVAPGSGSGIPAGRVNLFESGTDLGSCTLTSGRCTVRVTGLLVGTHTLNARYLGSSLFSAGSATLSQVVNQAATTISLTSSLNPSVSGQPVTLYATVAPVAPGGGTPSGTVTFYDGANSIGTGSLDNTGKATLQVSSWHAGSHSLTAAYPSTPDYLASTSGTVSQVVNTAATTTSISSSTNPSVFGQQVTIYATVAPIAPGSGTPSGTVTFYDGTNSIGTSSLDNTGKATLQVSSWHAGSHSLTAAYVGTSDYLASTSGTVSQVVNAATTTTSLNSSVNPSVFGQQIVLSATVAPVAPGSGTPSGIVTFYDGANSIGTGSLDNTGKATLQIANFTVGSHSLMATYGGSASFTSGSMSSALVQTVSSADFTLSASTGQTITAGQTVSFTITVAPNPAPYNFAVSGFSCAGLPAGTSCSFSPVSVTPGDSSSTVSVTVTTTARTSAAVHPKNRNGALFAMFGAIAFGIVVVGAASADMKSLRMKLLLFVVLVSCGSVIACGGGGGGGARTPDTPTVSGTPAGTYTITVLASGNGALNHSSSVLLVIK